MKIGTAAEPVYAAINSRYFFRLSGLSVEEMVSTPDASIRMALLEGCRRLTAGPWDCLNPFYEVLRILITAHAQNPAAFKWLEVDVRSGGLAHEIRTGTITADDAMAEAQRLNQKASLHEYEKMWKTLRPKLDEVFNRTGQTRPGTFDEAYRAHGPVIAPAIGKLLYDRGLEATALLQGQTVKIDTDAATVQDLIDKCTPFRAVLVASLLSWYDLSLRDRHTGEKFQAGRNDMFMAVYLPLCDIFVTRDAEQERCLKEIARVTGLQTEIKSLQAFTDSL